VLPSTHRSATYCIFKFSTPTHFWERSPFYFLFADAVMTYIQPLLTLFLLVFALETYRLWRQLKRGKPVLLGVAVIGLFLFSWLPFARMVLRPFEERFPPRASPAGDAQAIVVISGVMSPPNPATHEHFVGSDTYLRCLYAAWLYKHWHPLPVLCSGGPARGKPNGVPDALVMEKVLQEAGVPASMIWCEERSHSTHENALYSAEMLREKGIQKIVLVTSAFQMLRADLCFRKEGLAVTAAACDYRTFAPYRLRDFFPCWGAIRLNEDVLHEMVGVSWYWIHGWV